MTPRLTLAICGQDHEALRKHLFPGDQKEAAAILVCAAGQRPRLRLMVKKIIKVPHENCALREPDRLIWPGSYLETAVDMGETENAVLILIHSHPGGLFDFSEADDVSDKNVLPSLFHAYGAMHGSAIMTPNGAILARVYDPQLHITPIDLVSVVGDDLVFWWNLAGFASAQQQRPVAFTHRMTTELNKLSAAVIGASGTGSIVAEQLARLGFEHVILVDPDKMEDKNLNRILNSILSDAASGRLKVEVLAAAIAQYRGAGIAIPLAMPIETREAIELVTQTDVIFCCVDSFAGRHIADRIAATFLLPLFDVGVTIPTRKDGDGIAIADVCGRVDYIQPAGSTLGDRKVYTPETLRAEYLKAVDPITYAAQADAGYFKGTIEEAPSVISLNMRAAAACVNEFIARAYPFRLSPNQLYARSQFSLAAAEEDYTSESSFSRSDNPLLARGAQEPLLGLPALSIIQPEDN